MSSNTEISKGIKYINEEFYEKLWEEHELNNDIQDINGATEVLNKFKNFLHEIESNFYQYINLSILKGEYIDVKNCLSELNNLKNTVDSISPNIFPPSDIIRIFLYEGYFITNFISSLIYGIDSYLDFLSHIIKKISISEKEYFIGSPILSDFTNFDETSSKLINLFELNKKVAIYDHYLSSDGSHEHLKELLNIRGSIIKYYNIAIYSEVIQLKCQFLICKLILRNEYEKKGNFYILENGKEERINISKYFDKTFEDWIDYLKSHYSDENYTFKRKLIPDYNEKINVLKNKNLSDLEDIDLHRMIKFYKDIDINNLKRLSNLKDIRNEYYDRFKGALKNENKFDIYAYSISLNYAINNEFSLLCKLPDIKWDKINELYGEIMSIQNETGIKNFFPQTRYLIYLLKELRDKFDKNKVANIIAECRNIINKCKNIIEEYRDRVEWSEKNYNFVFQLPFNKCFIKVNNNQLIDNFFVFSTFYMPIPIEKMYKEFEDNEKEILQKDYAILTLENIAEDLETIKKLKGSETKLMEILAVFTAIVSFVAASLPTFKFIETPLQACLFILSLGTSFAVFVYVLIIVLRREKESSFKALISIILMLIFWVSFVLLRNYIDIKDFNSKIDENSQTTPTKVEINTNKADSTHKR